MRLEQLTERLRWNPETPELGPWTQEYRSLLDHRLADVLGAEDNSGDIAAGWGLLSTAQQEDVRRNPQVRHALCAGPPTQTAEGVIARVIYQSLTEEPVLGRTTVELDWKWSAAVDASTPFDFPARHSEDRGLSGLDGQGLTRSLTKLVRAYRLLEETDRPAWSFTGRFVDLLCLRKDGGRPDAFSSSSFSGYAGLVVLANPHLDRIDRFRLADALLHEAVHGALYMYAAVEGPLLARRPSPELRLQSPWSGRSLLPDSYVQACFVWYALARYWSRAFETLKGKEQESARHLMERAQAGFAKQPVSGAAQAVLAEHCAESTLGAITRLEELMIPGDEG